jgi:hypothetical protein
MTKARKDSRAWIVRIVQQKQLRGARYLDDTCCGEYRTVLPAKEAGGLAHVAFQSALFLLALPADIDSDQMLGLNDLPDVATGKESPAVVHKVFDNLNPPTKRPARPYRGRVQRDMVGMPIEPKRNEHV